MKLKHEQEFQFGNYNRLMQQGIRSTNFNLDTLNPFHSLYHTNINLMAHLASCLRCVFLVTMPALVLLNARI